LKWKKAGPPNRNSNRENLGPRPIKKALENIQIRTRMFGRFRPPISEEDGDASEQRVAGIFRKTQCRVYVKALGFFRDESQ
jgi:hypothetical protein